MMRSLRRVLSADRFVILDEVMVELGRSTLPVVGGENLAAEDPDRLDDPGRVPTSM
jgi:hypothetical protein